MKTLCFKFHQNRAVNEEFYFWGGKILSGSSKGGRVARFQKIYKSLYRTVVSANWGGLGPPRGGGGSDFKNVPYRTMVGTHSQNFSTLAENHIN